MCTRAGRTEPDGLTAVSRCCSSYSAVAASHFDDKIARRELACYRSTGPGSTARMLRDLLLATGPLGGVLLDVGSGIGGLTFELLEHGVARALAVDASPANLAAATEEAIRRGRAGDVQFVHGDFLDVAPRIPPATVVTLDRVVCCYPLYEPLLEESLRHAERCFAISYPRDVWHVHAAIAFENAVRRIRKNPFRAFVHPAKRMTRVMQGAGFRLVSRRQTWQWSADVYLRGASTGSTCLSPACGRNKSECSTRLGSGCLSRTATLRQRHDATGSRSQPATTETLPVPVSRSSIPSRSSGRDTPRRPEWAESRRIDEPSCGNRPARRANLAPRGWLAAPVLFTSSPARGATPSLRSSLAFGLSVAQAADRRWLAAVRLDKGPRWESKSSRST